VIPLGSSSETDITLAISVSPATEVRSVLMSVDPTEAAVVKETPEAAAERERLDWVEGKVLDLLRG